MEHISECLRLPQALKYLRYDVDAIVHPLFNVLETNLLKDALDSQHKSLQYLDIHSLRDNMANRRQMLWSFHNFVHLKVLHINYVLAYGVDLSNVPCIVDSLPTNIEILAMFKPYDLRWSAEDLIQIWKSLLLKKSSTQLRRLRVIGHLGSLKDLGPLVDFAEGCNVKVAMEPDDLREY
ncbi:hypothetical protein CPB86DRAFT_818451 [Serendipita vermifera]|nr:hypothetical protein CPB86DRAFT_818451 [Serendipita vermifera]